MFGHRTRMSENSGDVVILIFSKKNRIRKPNYSKKRWPYLFFNYLLSPTWDIWVCLYVFRSTTYRKLTFFNFSLKNLCLFILATTYPFRDVFAVFFPDYSVLKFDIFCKAAHLYVAYISDFSLINIPDFNCALWNFYWILDNLIEWWEALSLLGWWVFFLHFLYCLHIHHFGRWGKGRVRQVP